ncbi:MAG: DNA-directed RNA polymerase subunit beta' [Bacilli bacterium]
MEIKFDALKLGIASPSKIREWSYGEITKPETINYRTLKPEKDGLFCEKIFGPNKDFECACGKYKRLRYKNVVCDRCGVEVTSSKVRRERMGHIELAAPCSHIWFFKGVPSRIGLVLDMSPRELEEVLYYVSYIVLDKGATNLEAKQTISDRDYRAYYEKYGNTFKVGMGAEAIKELLSNIDIKKEIETVEKELENAQSQRRIRLIKRLEILMSFKNSTNKPEWMILDALPVIPSELRPMIQLDGGRFATSDLNDLYRRIINRNNRLKKLLELGAPSIIIQNEKRMLQEAVDALFDNGRRGRPITGPGNRTLKSLSSVLKGKHGRFRQNLLGKRVDYSARSVIVGGPKLKMHQCGLPKTMALELFKPHIIKGLVDKEIAHNIKAAKRLIENHDPLVWDIVEEVVAEHPVILNRAPTLHRLSIQAFEPKLIEGKAIRLHPLVCAAFNADFDGDQMPVHVPLSQEAKAEARLLMLASNNILKPADGKPVVAPSQDMVLGNYYLTTEKAGLDGEGRMFKNSNEVLMAYERREISLHTRICLPINSFRHKIFMDNQKNKYLITTVGKIIFNEVLPDMFPYICEPTFSNIREFTPNKYIVKQGVNIKEYIKELPLVESFNKNHLSDIIAVIYEKCKTTETSVMLDKLKDLGFKYSTKSGMSIAISDILLSENKEEYIKEGQKTVDNITKQFKRGLITERERYTKVVETWAGITSKVKKELSGYMSTYTENSIFSMANSKARGNLSNFAQLAGIRGLIAKPNGEAVEIPIMSSFLEGLSVSEFFLSTHGARKGGVDTALRTADAGYLTRRLVDAAQDVIIKEEDCGTIKGLEISAYIDSKMTITLKLSDRIVGRFANKKIIHPETKELLVDKGELITDAIALKIENASIEKVEIRSALTCKAINGVCCKCYGKNLATGNVIEVGEAVGIIAAQSIGEPGTQLTMRTFHTGGVASEDDITQGLPRIEELFEARNPKVKATLAIVDGKVSNIEESNGKYKISVENEAETFEHVTNYNTKLKVKVGTEVTAGDVLTEGVISPKELLAVTDTATTQLYILNEVQKVYSSQSVDISPVHIEIIIRRMINKVKISEAGDSNLFIGATVSTRQFNEINRDLMLQGKMPAVGKPTLLGITKASLETDSFLSAASFQETTKVLTDAAIKSKVDKLKGLKENVILGKLIPAGTGAKKYRDIDIKLKTSFLDEDPMEILENVFYE